MAFNEAVGTLDQEYPYYCIKAQFPYDYLLATW
jgi:hypothetical protein